MYNKHGTSYHNCVPRTKSVCICKTFFFTIFNTLKKNSNYYNFFKLENALEFKRNSVNK